nr:hypothetical protein [Streptomyces tsukubensis]
MTALSVLLAAGPASAGRGRGNGPAAGIKQPAGKAEGSSKSDGTLAAGVKGIVFDRSNNGGGSSAGAPAPVGNWSPPPCWYAPKYTPQQLKDEMEPIWAVDSTSPEWDEQQRKKYVKGGEYKDFNMKKTGDGFFWDSYTAEGFPPGWDACDKEPFWVDKGDPPPADAPQAVTPEILAQLAYAEIRVPGTEVDLAPDGTTKVNLATWAWLDKGTFKPVSVTASVPEIGLSATTTAEPTSLHIDPGTADATALPGSGECPIVNGRIGEPWAKGKADQTPPCGVTYRRSSDGGTYPLKATVTWKIHWSTDDGVEHPLPDGEFGTTRNVTVQEIQSVNR